MTARLHGGGAFEGLSISIHRLSPSADGGLEVHTYSRIASGQKVIMTYYDHVVTRMTITVPYSTHHEAVVAKTNDIIYDSDYVMQLYKRNLRLLHSAWAAQHLGRRRRGVFSNSERGWSMAIQSGYKL